MSGEGRPEPVDDRPAGGGVASAWEAGLKAAGQVRAPLARFLTLSWVPLTAAFLSLALSVTAIFISTQEPEVVLIMPDQVRIAQGRDSGSAYVYLQPAFVSTGRNDRVEVIEDMTLIVQPPGGGPSASFRWDEVARLVGDPDSDALSYEYVADAVPVLISPRSAAAPLSLFDAPEGWFFTPGRHTFTLVAYRVVASGDIRAAFDLDLAAQDVAFLDGPGASQFLTFPLR